MYIDDRGNPPKIENDKGEDFVRSEIEKAIKDLKTGKASENDMVTMITSEMTKAVDDTGGDIIYKLFNDICKTGVIPSNMHESIFIRLLKKPKTTMRA